MIPSKTRARLRAVEQQLSDPPPARLDGQTAIPLVWRQDALWAEPAPEPDPEQPCPAPAAVPGPGPAPEPGSGSASGPRWRGKRRPRSRRHVFDDPARPATRPRRDYVHGRRVVLVAPLGEYV
ncbi:hypothetical protein J116_000395 [Streptomyces thermolilacinus SPC6]|uniref:Uncharacterized protein n=1 Tax=Streptomyces thermolilacinus SPC6 TaxID=1306406 RepID=A0A1D3DLH6_9ACTN|nr:hypothetical protein J116_000395 [Streptomyces thermolilacinus SPC6]